MEMTHREPQTTLFPSAHVNLVNKKDLKIGESEHNRTVGITNSYAPNMYITPPIF